MSGNKKKPSCKKLLFKLTKNSKKLYTVFDLIQKTEN